MDAERLSRGRENAAMLIQEHLDSEAAWQLQLDSAQALVDTARQKRNAARRAASSEHTKWKGFDLPPLVFAEDKPEGTFLEYVRELIAEDAKDAPLWATGAAEEGEQHGR